MDPEKCLALAQRCFVERDRAGARQALRDYWEWRKKGGFEPKDGDKRAKWCAKLVACLKSSPGAVR